MALEMSSKRFGRDISYNLWKQSNKLFKPEGYKSLGSATKKFEINKLKEYKALPKKGKIISIEEIRQNKLQWIQKFGPEPSPIVSSSRDPLPIGGVSNSKFTTMKGKPIKFNKRVIPKAIRKGGGMLGKVGMGIVAGVNFSVMKMANMRTGAVLTRFMQDAAVGKNMLNNTRIGLARGTSRLSLGADGGVSLNLSKLRHRRGI